MNKKILYLSVKKQWYDMIVSGEKMEEYREINDYWGNRLFFMLQRRTNARTLGKAPYTHVLFTNGYGKRMPHVLKEIESITIGNPRKGWCPDEFLDKNYFIIKFK